MADSEKEFVPLEEYFDSDLDFGFTAVDNEESESEEPSNDTVSVSLDTEELMDKISSINERINSMFSLMDSSNEEITNELDFTRIEEKIDRILDLETNEFSQAIQENSNNIKVVIDEIEERKT